MRTKKRILLLGILGFSLLSSNILRADTEGNWEKLNNGKWIFIQNEKRVKSNWVDYKENWYYLLSNGEMKENGW
ncbi:cell wall-binding repeat protein, partial [Parvimonas sp. KA00067]